MTQISSDPKITFEPEFVFKGKGKKGTLNPPPGVQCQWSDSGSYTKVEMLKTIANLPNRSNPFTRRSGKNFAFYVLDNFAVHLMPEVRKALLNR